MRKPLTILYVLVGALLACKRGKLGGRADAGATSPSPAMTGSCTSKNGRIAVYSPADFAAKTVEKSAW